MTRCEVYGCEAGEHAADELRAIPLPGEQVYHKVVAASVYYADDGTDATLLLIENHEPYFSVARLDLRPHGNLTILSEHANIVPAVREYEQEGGEY